MAKTRRTLIVSSAKLNAALSEPGGLNRLFDSLPPDFSLRRAGYIRTRYGYREDETMTRHERLIAIREAREE